MPADEAFIWDRPTPELRPRRDDAGEPSDDAGERITLRAAERRFGVRASTLRGWARRGAIDATRAGGREGGQWMVTPESVAHHLSRHSPRVEHRGTEGDGSSMLVPRDAWDKLMDQLGNLHEAGLQLAEARERAAKAETEASFLRERLAEMREERNELRKSASEPRTEKRRRWWRRASD